MQFDYTSDIHVDINGPHDWAQTKRSDTILIAGDVSNQCCLFGVALADIARVYKDVIVVPGNHDFYDTSRKGIAYQVAMNSFYEQTKYLGNVHLLDHSPRTVGGVRFIGGIGWYDLQGQHAEIIWRNSMNDPHVIDFGKMSVQERAALEANRIENALLSTTLPAVVMTHTAPSVQGFDQHGITPLSPAYVNTGMEHVLKLQGHKIKAWIFGHTHERIDVRHEPSGVRLLSHPRGYHNALRTGPNWTGPATFEIAT